MLRCTSTTDPILPRFLKAFLYFIFQLLYNCINAENGFINLVDAVSQNVVIIKSSKRIQMCWPKRTMTYVDFTLLSENMLRKLSNNVLIADVI